MSHKPDPFSVYSTRELWTDEHTSEQMLAFHLNSEVDVSSRRHSFIDKSVGWMADRFQLSADKRIIDFGCGPGLYTSRLATLGATVYGVDFSPRSIAFAREQASANGLSINYVEADYLEYRPQGTFDLVIMIMCDFCALGPAERSAMLTKFRQILETAGRIVLDVYSLRAFELKQEGTIREHNLMDGFWSPEPYDGMLESYRYDQDKVGLDKYTISIGDDRREFYNWLQYFSVESLQQEIEAAGLEIEDLLGDVAGRRYDANSPEFAIVAKRR